MLRGIKAQRLKGQLKHHQENKRTLSYSEKNHVKIALCWGGWSRVKN